MTDTKGLLQSKTFAGVVIMVISALAPLVNNHFGIMITAEDGANAVDMIAKAGELAGSALALYGRIKATKKIG